MNMERPPEPSKEERIATLKRLIAENSRDLETVSGQDAIDAQRAIDVYQKDIAIIKAFAGKLKCPTPLFSLSKRYYDRAYRGGFEKHDTAAIHAVLKKEARAQRKR